MKVRLLLLGCVCVWGWTFVATRICLEILRPIDVVALRFLVGLPILLAIVQRERIPLGITRREALRVGLGAGILTVHFLMQAVALRVTSATHTGWIIAVSPLVIALASCASSRSFGAPASSNRRGVRSRPRRARRHPVSRFGASAGARPTARGAPPARAPRCARALAAGPPAPARARRCVPSIG